jgi:hypothetical protein
MFRSVNPGPRLFASEKVRPPILFIVSKSFSRFGQLAHQTNLPKGRPPERVPVPATTCDQQPRRWKSHFANGSRRFSGGAVVLQMGAVVLQMGAVVLQMGAVVLQMGAVVLQMGAVVLQMGAVILQMGAVIFPAEKSFCKWEQSFFRRKSHFVNVSSHFSGGKVVLQICRPPHKLAKPFFRRRNRFTNGSRRFSGGEIALQIGAVIFPAEKSFCKWEQSFFRRKSHLANLQNDRSYVKNP